MSEPSADLPPQRPQEPPRSADDVLPPVEAPSAGFLLQLFFIPLVIVTIIVSIWGMFSWLVHLGSDPRDLVKDIRAMNDASWQKAYTLSDALRNPEYDALKEDVGLARDLADLLIEQIESGRMDENRLRLRIYLARALGEFRIPVVAPALVMAATTQREEVELAVRRTAVEGLALLVGHVGHERLREEEGVLPALLAASMEMDAAAGQYERADLRASAAFALGVLGGEEALNRLERMLSDSYANARYNAATGLARHGDARAEPVLVEMLDPENRESFRDEASDSARERKRLEVLSNGIYAAARLADLNQQSELTDLREALDQLAQSNEHRAVRLKASEALYVLNQRP
jgi:HEAT repeat protein